MDMPQRAVHNLGPRVLLPWVDPKLVDTVNRLIDEPVKTMGSSHRAVRHDPFYAMRLAQDFGTPDAFYVAMMHNFTDAAAADPVVRLMMESMEMLARWMGWR